MAVKNIMIVGVGGQGTLLTSRILGGLTIAGGYDVKLSEVQAEASLHLFDTEKKWRNRLWKKGRQM